MSDLGGEGMTSRVNARRVQRIVSELQVDLGGLVVATEAATGPFAWTAALAAAAGADEVLVVARDTPYGSAAVAAQETVAAVTAVRPAAAVRVVSRREALQADVVTNLGSLRPFDREAVQMMRPGTALPLMWETWEWRPDELDLGACVAHDVLVLGTNESHPGVRTMSYVGMIAVKLLLDAGEPVLGQRVALIGAGTFVRHMAESLRGAGAEVRTYAQVGTVGDWAADVVLFADHESADLLVGDGGHLTAAEFASRVSDALVVHVSGAVDAAAMRAAGLRVFPARVATGPHRMTVTAGYVGVEPVLRLHAAGLAVGGAMARGWQSRRSYDGAIADALESPFAQDFTSAQWRIAGRV